MPSLPVQGRQRAADRPAADFVGCLQAYAEQSFLDWFFKYTAWHLPMEYNMNFAFLNNNATVGGSGELLPADQ